MTITPDYTLTTRAEQLTDWLMEDLKDELPHAPPGARIVHTTTETSARLLILALEASAQVRERRKAALGATVRQMGKITGRVYLKKRIEQAEAEINEYGCGGDDYERLTDMRALLKELTP